MVKKVWRQECSVQPLRLEHERSEDFLLSQWQTGRSVRLEYVLYRWLLCCYFLVTLACSVCTVSTFGTCHAKWLVYLTNWGYLLYTLQALVSACFITARLVAERNSNGVDPSPEPMKRVYKVFWALHTTSVVVAYCVSVTYWATIYDSGKHRLDAVNVLVHAANSVVMTVDLFVVRHPVRLVHVYLPLSFTLTFFLFSVVYYFAGGTSRDGSSFIYAMLDWGKPAFTVLCCALGLVFVSVVHAAVWLLYLLRRRLYHCFVCRAVRVEPHTIPSTSSVV